LTVNLLVRETLDDDKYRSCAEKYWQGKTEVIRQKLIVVTHIF